MAMFPKADQSEHLICFASPYGLRHAAHARPKRNVLINSEPVEKRTIRLKHHTAILVGSGDGLASNIHPPPRGGDEARDQIEKRSLATARRSKQTKKLAFVHIQVYPLKGKVGIFIMAVREIHLDATHPDSTGH